MTVAALSSRHRLAPFLVFGLVWTVSFLAFAGALDAAFVNYDDPLHILDNQVVLGGWTDDTLRWAFTTTMSYNWHPLTWISHITDVELFGLNAGGHHLTSVLLHATNAALFGLLLLPLTRSGWWSVMGALLFAVHPLRVESVAWISERKDVLSGLFLFVTLLAWQRFAAAGGLPHGRRFYVIALLSGACGLMSKPMLVTLPALLLVFNVWPLGRPWRPVAHLLEQVPFLLLSATLSFVTVVAQSTAISSLEVLPFSLRFENALVSVARYVTATVWPRGLLAPYHYPIDGWPVWMTAASGAFVVVTTGLALWHWLRRGAAATGPLAAWLWFVGALVPVLGLITVGSASMADRYTYVPHVLPAMLVAIAAARAVAWSRAAKAVSVVVCALLVAATVQQVEVWQSSSSLFRHAAAVEPYNASAWIWLARSELAAGDVVAAEAAARRAVAIEAAEAELDVERLRHSIGDNRVFLGRLLADKGDHAGAVEQYVEALSFDATPALPHALLAISLLALGDVESGRREADIARTAGALPMDVVERLKGALHKASPPPP